MKKYRPYFTLEELELINSELKRGGMYSFNGIIRYLDTYILGIKSGLRKENHTLKPTMSDSLGFSKPESTDQPDFVELYKQWKINPSTLTITDLEFIQIYRYENNLMSPIEERTYEASLGV